MQYIKENILIKFFAVALMLAVLLPAAVKFNHVFENHKHEVCDNPLETHFHNIDLDCEFYKFNLNSAYSFTCNNLDLITSDYNFTEIRSEYHFLNKYKSIGISLRGPPHSYYLFS